MKDSLYCPHCDKRLTAGHVRASRRVFLGALFGAIVAPRFIAPHNLTTTSVVETTEILRNPQGLWAAGDVIQVVPFDDHVFGPELLIVTSCTGMGMTASRGGCRKFPGELYKGGRGLRMTRLGNARLLGRDS
jgi:hypothetical protein